MRTNNNKKILLLFFLVVIASLSIGYVATGFKLNNEKLLNSSGLKWDVELSRVTSIETQGSGRSINTFLNGTIADIKYGSIGVDDSIIYTMNVVNNGTLDAKLNQIIVFGLNDEENFYMVDGLDVGMVLKSGENRLFTLTVGNYDSNTVTESNEEYTLEKIVDLKLILDFVQN